ncbi:MAG TPA: SMP-30/gluconolactonase/LRE family protein [Candidatus Acidoferrales bacterium]|nr:SMP-30/gluconolactonase/LRE family protein [Candidatus Acidoferrales bacterium]
MELIAALDCDTGENPLWCEERRLLLFVDIPRGVIYGYDPASARCDVVTRTRVTGGFTLQEDGSLLLFQDGRIAALAKDGIVREIARDACPGNERFNDVIADPEGRVFAGTLGGGRGRLLRFDTAGRVTEMMRDIGCANGMGFTPDLRGMYFTDSYARRIYLFEYDRHTGNLSKRRVFAEIPENGGLPDGLTVDTDGFVWTALWYGGRLQRYSPDGMLEREIFFPATQTSSITFGGPEFDEVYVTSAGNSAPDPHQPHGYDLSAHRGGGLYRTKVEGVKGRPEFRSRVRFASETQ